MHPRLSWFIILIAGLCAGYAGIVGHGQRQGEQPPAGWERTLPRTVWHSPSTVGELGLSPTGWALENYQAFRYSTPTTMMTVRARIPANGRLMIRPGNAKAQGGVEGPGLLLRRDRAVTGVNAGEEGETPLACTGELPAVTADPYTVSIARTEQGFSAQSGDASMQCRARLTHGSEASLEAGLHRVQILGLTVEGTPTPPPIPPALIPLGTVAGGLLMLAVAWLERRFSSVGAVVLTTTPLLLCGVFAGADLSPFYESMRLPTRAGVRWIPLLLGVIPTVLLKAAWYGGRKAHGWRGLWVVVAAGLVVATVPTTHGISRLYFGLSGCCMGGLLWANVNRWRGYNFLSLALVAGGLASAEWGVRWTMAGMFWSASDPTEGAGSAEVLAEEFDALTSSSHVPIANFPPAYGTRTKPKRVVCMGGSSTGGAYQNDNLSEFYPAHAQAMVDGVEFVNQGAGNWTSFHIRLYGASHMASLAPDVVTTYLGINESQLAPSTYADLYSMWEGGRLGGRPSMLTELRLFQGLRFVVRGLRKAKMVAVTPEQTRENLIQLADNVHEVGGKLLLMSEASQPRPAAFSAYWSVMKSVADEREDVAWLDTATPVAEAGTAMFLDQNHLSQPGHQRVAKMMVQKLQELEWIE